MTTPAVIYGVKSSPDEEESVADQHKQVLAAIEKEGDRFLVAEPFGESNQSGYRKERGPKLEAAMSAAIEAAAEHGEAELWVFHSSRLARGDGTKGKRSLNLIVAQLLYENVTVRSVSDPAFVTPMLAGIGSEVAHKYSADLSAHVKRGMRQKAKRGEHLSGPLPDGYRRPIIGRDQNGKPIYGPPEIDPERVEVVAKVLDLAKQGIPDAAIARSLNAQAITTRKGNPWTRRAVRKLVTNPWYCGRVRHGDDLFDGTHPRLIEPADWERLVAARPTQPRGPKGRPAKRHALKGLATCGECGRRMIAFTSPYVRKDGTRQRTYRCRSYAECNGSCSVYQFDAEPIDAAVLAALDDLLPDFEAWLAHVTERQSGERERLEGQRDRANRDRDEVFAIVEAAEKRWLAMDEQDQELVLGALRKAKTDVEHAETRLQAAQDALDSVPADPDTDTLLDFAASLQRALRGVDTSSNMAQVNAELAQTFEGFVIHPPVDGPRGRCPLAVVPVLHPGVARAILFENAPSTGREALPVFVSGEAPPMRWLTESVETRTTPRIRV
jgi:DNA invertase Pin-like site-specific DNA recombinase